MIKPILNQKVINAPCNGVKYLPADSYKYNRVQGRGPKGDFDIYSFYDKDGKILKRIASYVNELNGQMLKIRSWAKNSCDFFDTVVRNGKVTEYTRNFLFRTSNPEELLIHSEKLFRSSDGIRNIHKIGLFAPKRKLSKVVYETKFDGYAPRVMYKNTQGTLPDEGLEYLPLIVSENSRMCIAHVAKAQERKLGLEGIIPDYEIIPLKDLNPEVFDIQNAKIQKEMLTVGLTDPENCQITFADTLRDPDAIIRVVTHEYAHADDFAHVARLKHIAAPLLENQVLSNRECKQLRTEYPDCFADYIKSLRTAKKLIAKGLVTKQNTDLAEYWRYKRLSKYMQNMSAYEREVSVSEESYKNHFAEIRPLNVEKKELEFYEFLFDKLYEILGVTPN